MQFISPPHIFTATAAVIIFGTLKYSVGVSFGSGFDELSLATLWSVALLGLTSWVCFRIADLPDAHGNGGTREYRFFWRFVAFSFAFLAADDGLRIHEHLDKLFHFIFGIEETGLTDRLDDLIVLCYVIAGGVLLYRYRNEITEVRGTVPLLFLAVFLALVMVMFDTLSGRMDYLDWFGLRGPTRGTVHALITITEELAKLLAGATLLVTFARIYRAKEPNARGN